MFHQPIPLEPGHLVTHGPATTLALEDAGSLRVGMRADVTIVDPTLERRPAGFTSKSGNSPFVGRALGRPLQRTLAQFGLLGLLYAFRHPALDA